MNLNFAEQIYFEELQEIEFDIIIVASGFESRCLHLVKRLKKLPPIRFAITYTDRKDKISLHCDSFLKDKYFTLIENTGDLDRKIWNYFYEFFSNLKADTKILIDYSSMTKIWYATIISILRSLNLAITIEVYFSYSFAKNLIFEGPEPNVYMGPIKRYYNIDLPNKSTALIMGLGCEPFRAHGIYEYIEAAENFAIYPDESFQKEYSENMIKNNSFIFTNFPSDRKYSYPANNFRMMDALLRNLYSQLIDKYRIILAPMGPKPFSLLALLFYSKFKNLDIWRVSSGISGKPIDRIASGEIIICKTIYTNKTEP
jgi:hypothetical protein